MSKMQVTSMGFEHLINQLDGLYAVCGLDTELWVMNQKASSWLGFSSPDQGSGTSYENLPCSVAEASDFMRSVDQLIVEKNTRVFHFGYCGYKDGYRMIQGVKAPFYDENQQIIGISCQLIDVTHVNFINYDHFVFKPDYLINTDKKTKQFCYLVVEKDEDGLLSEREKECLFFFLRKKTAKEIAAILSLSPRTVEAHLENIRAKLNCPSKSALIERATLENLGSQLPLKYLKQLWKT